MKKKVLLALMILTLSVGCNKKDNQAAYILEDTWGEDGNWSEETQLAQKAKAEKALADKANTEKEKDEPVEEESPEPENTKETAPPKVEKTVAPTAEPVKVVKSTPVPEKKAEPEKPKEEPLQYTNSKYAYGLKKTEAWENKGSMGPITVNYSKEVEDMPINFSVAVLRSLKADSLNSEFKEKYLKSLPSSFQNLKVIDNQDTEVKGKKAWSITYLFEKDGEKIQQRQVFIPHKDHTLVMNWVATEDGFYVGREAFATISDNMVLL